MKTLTRSDIYEDDDLQVHCQHVEIHINIAFNILIITSFPVVPVCVVFMVTCPPARLPLISDDHLIISDVSST